MIFNNPNEEEPAKEADEFHQHELAKNQFAKKKSCQPEPE
jgi:hypothetical protein